MATVLKNVKKDDRFMSLAEAAKLHGVTTQTIRRWINAGILEAYDVGGLIVCARTSVETARARVAPQGKPGHKASRKP